MITSDAKQAVEAIKSHLKIKANSKKVELFGDKYISITIDLCFGDKIISTTDIALVLEDFQ